MYVYVFFGDTKAWFLTVLHQSIGSKSEGIRGKAFTFILQKAKAFELGRIPTGEQLNRHFKHKEYLKRYSDLKEEGISLMQVKRISSPLLQFSSSLEWTLYLNFSLPN